MNHGTEHYGSVAERAADSNVRFSDLCALLQRL
jgi:hypothetical protein